MANWFTKRFDKRRNGYACSAVIAAAGSSSRMGGENKLFLPLEDVPVLARTLQVFQQAPSVKEIVVATREEDLIRVGDLCKTYGITKATKVVKGGTSRVESVLQACLECSPENPLIAVHDGARPLVTVDLIEGTVAAAARYGAAAPAVPVKDTIKVAEGNVVRSTPERSTLRAIQTPQIFDSALLRAALQSAVEAGAAITDDCSAVERIGKEIYLTDGSEENLKITTPLDVSLAEAILKKRGEQ